METGDGANSDDQPSCSVRGITAGCLCDVATGSTFRPIGPTGLPTHRPPGDFGGWARGP